MPAPILVGLALREDDAAPLALARRLAALGGAPLVLVNAVPHDTPARFPTPEYAHALRDDAASRLDAVASELDDAPDVSTVVCVGSPAGALHDMAEERRAAAVVVGSTHRGALGRLLIGEVGAGLLHGSRCPVAIAPRRYEERAQGSALERIGIAFDGSPESHAALEAAIAIALRTGGFVHSFTVLEPLDWSPSLTRPGLMPPAEFDQARRESAQTTAEHPLEAIPEGLRGASEVLHGSVVDALSAVSSELDVLVCGSRGYGALRRVMAGSVARGLAHRAECPLIVIPGEAGIDAHAPWATTGAGEAMPS
jgi:nucleotide-binding universal stress UspA family protein